MPQMMPMLWTLLLIFSIMTLLTTISLIYFNFSPSPSSLSLPIKESKKFIKWNWMW